MKWARRQNKSDNIAFHSELKSKREREVQKVRRRAANELIPFVSNYEHFVDFVFYRDSQTECEWTMMARMS